MIKNKIAIYCRRSNANSGGTSQSIETQKKEGIAFAAKEGGDYEIFIDEGISGTKEDIADRPAFAQMLSEIKKGGFDKVYCIDQSRIERNNNIWNLFVSILLDANCKYYPSGRLFDLDDDNNIFIAGVLSQANQLFASLTSKKVKLANKLNAAAGKTHGIVAYGYKRGKNGNFEIDEEQAKIVRKIFKWSEQAIGTYTIANMLNKDGVPTKFNAYDGLITRKDNYTGRETKYKKSEVKWRGNVIHDMIRNPIYKGIYTWDGVETELDVFIIPPHEWQSVNNNLPNNKKNVGRRDEYNYLLNGLIFCSDCGSEFRGKKRLKGSDIAYKCKGKRYPNAKCESRGINIPRLETFIIKHLFESKHLKEILTQIPNDQKDGDVLQRMLEKKKSELSKCITVIKNGTNLLLEKGFEQDSEIIEKVRKEKEKLENLRLDIYALNEKIEQRNTNYRQERAKSIIESTSIDAGYEKMKFAVHSLIERIDIKHQKLEKGGIYSITIKYKNFEEYSTFLTNWQGLDWYWINRYRKEATNEEELEQDREEVLAYLEYKGIKVTEQSLKSFQVESGLSDEQISEIEFSSQMFKGVEQVIGMHEKIELNLNELVNFD